MQFDHVHSWEWFSEKLPTAATRWAKVQQEMAVARHGGDVANYLFADGHKREANDIETKFLAECEAPAPAVEAATVETK